MFVRLTCKYSVPANANMDFSAMEKRGGTVNGAFLRWQE